MSADKYPSIFSRQMEAIVYIFPNFQNCARCEKDLKDNKHNSLHLGRKYARIFVLRHYLFLVAHSFPRATLSENCWLLGTDNRDFKIRDATASRTQWLIMDWDKNAVVCAGKVKLRSPRRSKKTRLRNALYQCYSSSFLSQK